MKRNKKNRQNSSSKIKSIAFLLLILSISLYLAYFYFNKKFGYHQADITVWSSSVNSINISEEILHKLSTIEEKNSEFTFLLNAKNITVFIREPVSTVTSKITVLLLHGAGSSSKIWEELNTIQLIGAMGLKVVAIDLPGWGNSKSSRLNAEESDQGQINARFLKKLIRELNLGHPIIISPSMSGSFSIPYMMLPEPETCHERLLAYIPIAPVRTQMFTHAQYHRCEIPTMIVYGTNDTQLGLTSVGNLRNMPNMELKEMINTGHACYIDRPFEWNTILYNFILNLQRRLGEI